MPDEVPNLAAELAALASKARERLPQIVRSIEEIVRGVDPINLLSQLSILYLTHPVNAMPDRDDKAKWQVRIEWLVWLILARKCDVPPSPQIIDSSVLTPIEGLLDDYFNSTMLSLQCPVDGLTSEENRLRASLQMEALVVRGLGFQKDLRELSVELYAPHDEWCLANIGLTVRDAFEVAEAVGALYTEKVSRLRREAARVEADVREDPRRAASLPELPADVRQALGDSVPAGDLDQFASAVRGLWFYSQAPFLVSFHSDEVAKCIGHKVALERIVAFFELLAASAESVEGEPDPIALSPLAFGPFVRRDNRFFLFVAPLLYEGIFYAFHRRLYADAQYRARYDRARAGWLEAAALGTLRDLLPNSEWGWSLEYGPKKERAELDGLVLYDGKLILIECKWKSPTLAALRGDIRALAEDFKQAILVPMSQAKRAADFIVRCGEAEFIEKATGRRIVVRMDQVSEVFVVAVVGSGAWSPIAANLREFAPKGSLSDGEHPWALSLNDLRAVTHVLELPSQLFDYLRRRRDIQSDGRFHLHDEWDFLGVYLAGALDPLYPKFREANEKGVQRIALDGFDGELQDYYYSLSASMEARDKPRRAIPKKIREMLSNAEQSGKPGRTDAICSVLAFPDEALAEIDQTLEHLRRKTIIDGKAHAAATVHPWRPIGLALATGYGDRDAILKTLRTAAVSAHQEAGAIECAGVEWDLASADGPLLTFFGNEAGIVMAIQ
jgi:hypothetical protein